MLLEPGVSMYLPTGTPHAARAQDTASLHVTIGINQVTWAHVLDRAVGRGPATAPTTQHLPAGYLDDPALLAEGLADRLEALAAALRGLDPAAVADAEVRRFLTGRTLGQRGGLADRLAGRELADDTALERRPGHPCVLRPRRGAAARAARRPGADHARAPAPRPGAGRARPATFRPADLADHLDAQSRLVLCRRLVREGLLRASRLTGAGDLPLLGREPGPRRAGGRHRLHGPGVPARRERRSVGRRRAA